MTSAQQRSGLKGEHEGSLETSWPVSAETGGLAPTLLHIGTENILRAGLYAVSVQEVIRFISCLLLQGCRRSAE